MHRIIRQAFYQILVILALLMRIRWIRTPTIWLSSKLRICRKRQTPEFDGGRWHPQTRRHIELCNFIEESGVDKGARILDVGCGPGWLIDRLMSDGYSNIRGCDWEDRTFDHFDYHQVDLNAKGLEHYRAESADVVMMSDVLEHMENPAWLLRECRRVVLPDGHMFITLPNCWNIFERVNFLATGNCTRYRSERVSAPFGHISMFTPAILESLIDRAGLQLVELRGGYAYFYGFFWGSVQSPLLSHNLMYHFIPDRRTAEKDRADS